MTLSELIHQDRALFWDIGEKDLDKLIERILNYGNEKSVKQLFDILGVEYVAKIFKNQINQPRQNYFPETVHYFNLYFSRHAPKYSHS